MAAAAIPIISTGIGLLAAKKLAPKPQAPPPMPALPPVPDAAAVAAKNAEAAQTAAAQTRRRATNLGIGGTLLTGPSGLTTPAPVVRKTLLGQ